MSGPITPTPPTGAQAPTPKGQVVQIVSLPDGLRNNARAIRIEGEVVQQNKDGSVRIRTEQGDVDIQVRGRQPQVGAKVEVEIPAGHPPRTANLRPAPVPVPTIPLPQTPAQNIPLPQTPAIAQPTPEQPTTKPAPQQPVPTNPAPVDTLDTNAPIIAKPTSLPVPQPPVQTTQAAPVPTTLPPLSTGQIVQIIPLSAETPDAPLPQQPQTNPAAQIIDKVTAQATQAVQKVQGGLIGNLIQAVKSALPAAPAIAAQPVSIAIPAEALMPQPITQQTTLPPSLAQQQPLVLTAKVLSIVPPLDQRIFMPQTQTPSIVPQTNTAQITIQPITVTVGETTAQNKPVITIPMNNTGATQNFVMQASASSVPMGTQITLLPQITAAPAAMNAATPMQTQAPQLSPSQVTAMPPAWRALLPLMQPLSIWPAMDDVFQSFYQATPQAAQILGRIIPTPANGQSFGPAAMLFIAAIKSGDIQGWLGDKKLEMIQKLGKEGLVSRLSGEAATLSQNADGAPTDWKSYPIPLLYQNEISKVLFHVRREPEDESQQQDGGTTRFVMDVSLTRMGDVQLDALVRGNRVDLTVRTELPVSHSMQDAMRTAYATALDNTMIYGDIGFQSDVKNFISVLGREDALASV